MEITEVRIFLRDEEKLKAYATVTFDNAFVVRNLRIIKGDKGLFVAMPSKKMNDGTYRDICHPINNEMRHSLEKKIVDAYNDELAKPSDVQNKTEDYSQTAAQPVSAPEQAPVRKPGEFDNDIN